MAKTPLQKAFKKIDELNLSITLDQRRELNKILCALATASFREGVDMTSEMAVKIYTK